MIHQLLEVAVVLVALFGFTLIAAAATAWRLSRSR